MTRTRRRLDVLEAQFKRLNGNVERNSVDSDLRMHRLESRLQTCEHRLIRLEAEMEESRPVHLFWVDYNDHTGIEVKATHFSLSQGNYCFFEGETINATIRADAVLSIVDKGEKK